METCQIIPALASQLRVSLRLFIEHYVFAYLYCISNDVVTINIPRYLFATMHLSIPPKSLCTLCTDNPLLFRISLTSFVCPYLLESIFFFYL